MRTKPILSGLVAGFFAATSLSWTAPARGEDAETWRLFVTDQAEGKVTALDPDSGEVLDVFATEGYVTHLVPSDSGALLVAVQMDHDRVAVIASGIHLADHGDHQDIEIEAPALLPLGIEGGRPVHAVMHGDEIIQFFDREGAARVFSEAALLEGSAAFETIEATAPHHGVAVPMGDHVLISEPDLAVETEPDALPPRLGLKVLDQDGAQVGEVATCTGLHGEAASAGMVGFGCDEGVLVAAPQPGSAPALTMLEYGDDLPKARVGTLLGGTAMQFFLGNYGDDAVVVIDPSVDRPYTLVELPVRRVDFALDPKRVRTAYVFTEDGELHALDVLKGELVRSAPVTEPYSKDGHWRDPRPRLAVMGDFIAVTDPRAGLVRLVDAETFESVRTIPVAGLPFNVVAVGGSGVQH